MSKPTHAKEPDGGGMAILLYVLGTFGWSVLWVAGLAPLLGLGELPVAGHLIAIAAVPMALALVWHALRPMEPTSTAPETPVKSGEWSRAPVKLLNADEQAVTIELRYSEDIDVDTSVDVSLEVSGRLREAVSPASVGELHDLMDTLVIFGPDANAILAKVRPVLTSAPSCIEKINVILRFGSVAPDTRREVKQIRP